jgi:hypothetical protein
MNREQAEKYIQLVLDGTATPAERDEFNRLVESDASVAQLWESMQSADQALRGIKFDIEDLLPETEIPQGMTELVMQKWNLEQPPATKRNAKQADAKARQILFNSKIKRRLKWTHPVVQIGVAAAAIAFWVGVIGVIDPQEGVRSPESFQSQSISNPENQSALPESDLPVTKTEATAFSNDIQSSVDEEQPANLDGRDSGRGNNDDPAYTSDVSIQDTVTTIPLSKSIAVNLLEQTPVPMRVQTSKQSLVQPKREPSADRNATEHTNSKVVSETANRIDPQEQSRMKMNSDNESTSSPSQSIAVPEKEIALSNVQTLPMSVSSDAPDSMKHSDLLMPKAITMSKKPITAEFAFDDGTKLASLDQGIIIVRERGGVELLRQSIDVSVRATVQNWEWSLQTRMLNVAIVEDEQVKTVTIKIP